MEAHHHENEEEKSSLPIIIIGGVMGLAAYILTETVVFNRLFGNMSPKFSGLIQIALWLTAYMIPAFHVIIEAGENVIHGDIFNEDTLMVIASAGAFVIGERPEAVAVMLFFRLGELFEDKALEKSRKKIMSLMDVRPDFAVVLREGCEVRTEPEKVLKGEIIVVKPGEKIPLDGEVIEGSSEINTVSITGESAPRNVLPGDKVFSGCVNINGLIKVKTESEFCDSTVSRILKLVEESEEKKAKTENFIGIFARYYTPAVVGLAALIGVLPSIFTGQWSLWLYRALTFLVVSCPCALVVSVPLTFFAGIGGASKSGILIKGANHMDVLAKSKCMVFDKTGTITKGSFSVDAIHSHNISEAELLDITAAAESYSKHPVAESIIAAHKGHIDKNRIGKVNEIPGLGLTAEVDGRIYYVGNSAFMDKAGVLWKPCHLMGTIVHVARENEYLGHIVINDELKNDSADAISELSSMGVDKMYMLTGDREEAAEDVAQKAGISNYKAGLLPENKIEELEKIMSENSNVIFAGDGINDAPALMRADLGVAMGALGSDAAIEASDVVIMDDSLSKLPKALAISRRTIKIARENIIFALSVKILILILSAFGVCNMWVAVFGDVGVLILAVLNSLRAMKKCS